MLTFKNDKLIKLWFSGKILISGEYLALKGATCLSLPTRYGQKFLITQQNDSNSLIKWKLIYNRRLLFQTIIEKKKFKVRDTTNLKKSKILQNLFIESRKLNNNFLQDSKEVNVICDLEHDPSWGMGSSASLTCCIAKWAKINSFDLYHKVFFGSGFDIATLEYNTAILYNNKNRLINPVKIKWPFLKNIVLVHLNKKVNSQLESFDFIKKNNYTIKDIDDISNISKKLVVVQNQSEFESLLKLHEKIMSKILNQKTIYKKLFSDYTNGVIKSLGAWGGDMILVSTNNITETKNYFYNKGYNVIVSLKELITQ